MLGVPDARNFTHVTQSIENELICDSERYIRVLLLFLAGSSTETASISLRLKAKTKSHRRYLKSEAFKTKQHEKSRDFAATNWPNALLIL